MSWGSCFLLELNCTKIYGKFVLVKNATEIRKKKCYRNTVFHEHDLKLKGYVLRLANLQFPTL